MDGILLHTHALHVIHIHTCTYTYYYIHIHIHTIEYLLCCNAGECSARCSCTRVILASGDTNDISTRTCALQCRGFWIVAGDCACGWVGYGSVRHAARMTCIAAQIVTRVTFWSDNRVTLVQQRGAIRDKCHECRDYLHPCYLQ